MGAAGVRGELIWPRNSDTIQPPLVDMPFLLKFLQVWGEGEGKGVGGGDVEEEEEEEEKGGGLGWGCLDFFV